MRNTFKWLVACVDFGVFNMQKKKSESSNFSTYVTGGGLRLLYMWLDMCPICQSREYLPLSSSFNNEKKKTACLQVLLDTDYNHEAYLNISQGRVSQHPKYCKKRLVTHRNTKDGS